MVSMSDKQIPVVMSHHNSFDFASNMCKIDVQYFCYFNSFPMISSSHKIPVLIFWFVLQ